MDNVRAVNFHTEGKMFESLRLSRRRKADHQVRAEQSTMDA